MRASTRLIAPTHLDKSNRYKILSSPQTHNSGYRSGAAAVMEDKRMLRDRLQIPAMAYVPLPIADVLWVPADILLIRRRRRMET